MNQLKESMQLYSGTKDLSPIDARVQTTYQGLLDKLKALSGLQTDIKDMKDKIADTSATLAEAVKEADIEYRLCPNCGEVVVFD